MWQFWSPKIVFGEESLEYLAEVKGNKAFIVTDEMMVKMGYVDRIENILKGSDIQSVVFNEVEPDPSYETVLKGKELLEQNDCDLIIGLGGGSPMDVAKAVRILYENPDVDIEDLSPMVEISYEKTKLILIPTTSGTGAEVTPAIVLTSKGEGRKVPTTHPDFGANLAIVDPSLVMNLPKPLIAHTGMDALTHTIDAYISGWKNDFSDGLAIKALNMIFKYLPRSYSDSTDKEAKEKMHIAATIAGLAFGNSQAGLSHTLGHTIGAVFHMPHGKACGICLPYTIQYASKSVGELIIELARYTGIQKDDEEAINEFVDKIFNLMDEIDIPRSLKDAGIKREDYDANLDKLMENSLMDATIGTLPRIPTDEDFHKLWECVYEGRTVDF
ncbi:MAG TPA: iron-containing alcohol dehydrogenase [Halobacteria archaeon]|nr:iron-containing alcohol dehydrogenase [Halobacteria archaeon]